MEITCSVEWNTKTLTGLHRIPDGTLYTIAKETLDMSVPKIPMSNITGHSGTLRRSSTAGGVKGGNGDYWIGSYTNYASSVWKMPQSTTNWTNPKSKAKWYAYTLKNHQKTIIDNAINKSWRKDMQ